MKRLFIAILILHSSTAFLNAKLEHNSATGRFYFSPATPEVDQNEYHTLVWACKDILNRYAQQHQAFLAQYPGAMQSSAYDPNNQAGKNAAKEHLQRIATPTSMRLLADLSSINFNIY
jgi:hypothetical protein